MFVQLVNLSRRGFSFLSVRRVMTPVTAAVNNCPVVIHSLQQRRQLSQSHSVSDGFIGALIQVVVAAA